MSFWWTPKTSSPKKNLLENSNSFSSFEQLTRDVWEVVDDPANDFNSLEQSSNQAEISHNSSIDNYKIGKIDIDKDKNFTSSHSNYDLKLSLSNDIKYNKDDSGKNISLDTFVNMDKQTRLDTIARDNLRDYENKKSINIVDNLELNSNEFYSNLFNLGKINHDIALQMPLSDVHRLAEEIVQLHQLSFNKKTNGEMVPSQNNNNLPTYKNNDDNISMVSNNKSISHSNNNSLSKFKYNSFKIDGFGSSRLIGPGIGVRKKNIYSHNNWFNNSEEEKTKICKFTNLLQSNDLDIDSLRRFSWSGIPMQCRADVWKILCGYLPLNPDRREAVIERKRLEYFNCVDQYFGLRNAPGNREVYHQIHIDIPRMQVLLKVFKQVNVQEMFERILYTWAIRHPASSYVQGINDLLVPFFIVFLSKYVDNEEDLSTFEVTSLPLSRLNEIEADSYWCLSKLLAGIQDNYTFAQPGIQKQVNLLKELTARLDVELHDHLSRYQIEYLQFSFRWFNNLLMREIPLHCIIRLWDAFLSEVEGFTQLHLFVCSALLLRFSSEILKEEDFQGIMIFLGRLPTDTWTSSDISLLLADAHRLRYTFADTPNHYRDL